MSEKKGGENPNPHDVRFWSLALGLLEKGKPMRFAPTGSSMAPFIRHGETVTIMPCAPNHVKPGDIVLYATESDHVGSPKRLHRVIEKKVVGKKCLFVTKGDAVPDLDLPIQAGQILGKVSAIEKRRWELDLDRPWAKTIHLAWFLLERWALWRWLVRVGWRTAKGKGSSESIVQ
jgi:hypothetical protein